jgi:heme exporter protein A
MGNDAIAVRKLWKYYGDYPALREITLDIAQGSCCALLGRNGAGKTTLLRILAGLAPYQQGEISLFGEPPRGRGVRRAAGFLGHGIGVYEDLTAAENLRFFARVNGIKDSDACGRRWLARVGLERAKMPVRQFSRGMRQRLALARTFQHEPAILLLDEPFTSLDDKAIAMLSELLSEARQRGATIVLSTHQLREALAIASDVALIENGKLRFAGERTAEMLHEPSLLYRLHTELGAD